jgi:hypothetical protein
MAVLDVSSNVLTAAASRRCSHSASSSALSSSATSLSGAVLDDWPGSLPQIGELTRALQQRVRRSNLGAAHQVLNLLINSLDKGRAACAERRDHGKVKNLLACKLNLLVFLLLVCSLASVQLPTTASTAYSRPNFKSANSPRLRELNKAHTSSLQTCRKGV